MSRTRRLVPASAFGASLKVLLKVLVKPAVKRLEQVPAVYETVTEQVLERAGDTTWKKGQGPFQRIDNAPGEIMCLVELPPVYKTITKQTVKQPATTRDVEEPAQYSTVKKRVEKTPAATREVDVPAEY